MLLDTITDESERWKVVGGLGRYDYGGWWRLVVQRQPSDVRRGAWRAGFATGFLPDTGKPGFLAHRIVFLPTGYRPVLFTMILNLPVTYRVCL
jgi:hypothetical protein